MHNLDQWIRNVGLGYEGCAVDSTANIHRIGDGCLYSFDPPARADDRNAGRVRYHLTDSQSRRKATGDSRVNSNGAIEKSIERQLKLTGNDLHNVHILRKPNLPRRQIERAVPGSNPGKVHFHVHVAGT